MTTEKWQTIIGFSGYQVSDQGRVRSRDRFVRCGPKGSGMRLVKGRVLRPGRIDAFGHVTVALGKGNTKSVHVLVAAHFIGPRPDGYDVAHKNGIGGDNRARNLRYSTRSENNRDIARHGRSKLSLGQVHYVRSQKDQPRGWRARVARELGVDISTISRIASGEIYGQL